MTATTSGKAAAKNREEVVDSIDKAIATRASVASVDGLTISTLTLAGASLLWFVMSRPDLSGVSIVSALRAYTAAYVWFQCFAILFALVASAESTAPAAAPRIIAVWVRRLHHGPAFIVSAVHGTALALVSWFLFDIALVLRIALVVSLLAPVLTLTHAYWPIAAIGWTVESAAIPRLRKSGYAVIGGLLTIVLSIGVAAVVGASRSIGRHYSEYTMDTLRFVLVFSALVLVANRVAKRLGESNVLSRLAVLRDEVAFGRSSPELGLARARLLLVGGDLADFVQPELEAIANSMDTLRNAMATFVKFGTAMGEAFRDTTDDSVETAEIWRRAGFGPERLDEVKDEIVCAQREFG